MIRGKTAKAKKFIDLRSDTFIRPSLKMRTALAQAEVEDLFYDDKLTVEILEGEIAKLFGKESSLLVPSGTMSNLIGMMVNVRRKGEGAIVGNLSHVYNFERGGISAVGGIHPILLNN